MTAPAEPVGVRLRRLRTERGLSQRALSGPGVSYAYISRIEAGSRTPSVKALRVLARKLGVSPEYLETGADLTPTEDRELRLRNAELQVRLAEDTGEALTVLQDLENEAEAAGDAAVALRVKALLALGAQLRGERAAVIRQLEPVVAERPSPVVHWELYALLGRAYTGSGRAEDAAAMFRTCLEEVEREAPHDDLAWARTATMLSAALSDAGDLAKAREVAAAALQRASAAGDPLERVRLHWSYAQMASREHKPRVALERLRGAVMLLEETEDTHELAHAHLFWAEILISEGEPEQAEPHLTLAERLLGTYPARADIAKVHVERSRAATAKGEPETGIELAAAALEQLAESDDGTRASAQWALGEAQLGAGREEEGIQSLDAALDLFEAASDWYRAAAVAKQLGRVLREAGRGADALNVLERAVQFATLADASGRRPSPHQPRARSGSDR